MADRETDFFVTSVIGIKLNLLNHLDKKKNLKRFQLHEIKFERQF